MNIGRWWPGIALLLALWAVRLPALEALPLHNDEGLHLRRALEVWNGHPFWDISDGKIINHWLIAAFYPQNTPVFAGRIATVLTGMIGLAAGYALARWRFGGWAALLAGGLWITAPYLFFFERVALSDAQAGALVVLALWLALLTARYGRGRYALLTGLALGAAVLFKFTAAPFALMVALVLLRSGAQSPQRRVLNLAWAGAAAALCFVPPLAYLLLRGRDFFSIALGWIGGSSGGELALVANVERLGAVLAGFGTLAWVLLLVVGLMLIAGRSEGRLLLIAAGLPLAVMLVLAGCGLGGLLHWLSEPRERWTLAGMMAALLIFSAAPFMSTAYRDPGALPLPDAMRTQYITDHSAGYGLREAVLALPQIIEPGATVIASMFPDSCRRANFYAREGYTLTCTHAPGLAEIEAALGTQLEVYVLVDNAPLIGVDVALMDALAVQVAAYPRPGETPESASVVLWRLKR